LGVSATDGTSTAFVTVTWSAVVGVKGYDIFRGDGSTKIGSSVGTATTFNDETAVAGNAYAYTVKATPPREAVLQAPPTLDGAN